MPKYTKAERQYIKGIVHNYALQRWSDQDIVDYLHTEKKIDLTKSMISKIRNQVEQQAEEWYLELKQSRYLYLAHFKERIDTLYSVEKQLWEIANDKHNQVVDRRGALAEIHHTEKTLSSLYDISRYLTDVGIVPIANGNGSNGKPDCYGSGCTCSITSMDNRTHSLCRYCHIMWCHSTYNQDWCPNVECSHGLKGHHFNPYDEHNVWVQCNGCKQWFKKQEILDIHKNNCSFVNGEPLVHQDQVMPKPEIEAPEWVETKQDVFIPKEQPQLINQIIKPEENLDKAIEISEGPKEGDVIGPKWTPAEAYKALKKSKAGSNTETTTTSF